MGISWFLINLQIPSFVGFDFAVELDYMLVIPLDIPPRIFFPGTSECKVSMYCILWDGMHLVCQQNNMQLRFACFSLCLVYEIFVIHD